MEKNRQENTEDEKTEKFSGNVSEESDSDSSQNEEQQSSKKGKLRKNEIRNVLLGNFALNEEGKTVAGRNSLITSNGIDTGIVLGNNKAQFFLPFQAQKLSAGKI